MTQTLPLITVAPNGARHGKDAHPALPITVAEIADCALASLREGAGAIHLHVRDAQGRHVLDPELANTAVEAVEAITGGEMLVQVTTEAVGRYSPEEQRAFLGRLRSPAASLALRELIPDASEEAATAAAIAEARARGVALQYLLHEAREIPRFADLVRRGIIPSDGLEVLFVLGRYGGDDTDVADLGEYMVRWRESGLADGAAWMICAFGPPETRAMAAAMAMGGKARVGFENNFRNADGSVARDNAERIGEVAAVARAMGLMAR